MIVLTGGAGFIGSAFLWELNLNGIDDVLVVDHLGTSEKWKNLRGLRYRDYLEKDRFLEVLNSGKLDSQIKAVFHLGACSSTTESDCSYLIQNNYEYSKTLALHFIKRDVPFYYASSAATYGDGQQGYSDRTDIDTLRPLNMYGYSKQMFDQWILRNQLQEKVVGFKFFNVWGPNEYHKASMRSMVVKAYEQVKKTSRVKLFKSYHPDYKDGEQMRDFVYVKDVTKMMLQFYHKPRVHGIFNLGSGQANTWLDLVNPIFKALNMKSDVEFIEMPEELRGKYQYYTKAAMDKFSQLGFTHTQTPLEDAVEDFVLNYLEKSAYLELS